MLKFTGERDLIFHSVINHYFNAQLERLEEKNPVLKNTLINWLTSTPLTIDLSTKLKTTGGLATYNQNKITLNKRLLQKNMDKLENTLNHELAHLLSFKLYGREGKGHGKKWKETMITLGRDPKRCHQMDVSTIVNRHHAICSCTVFKITTNMKNKILKGQNFKCKSCHTRIIVPE